MSMPAIDIERLSPEERLRLIADLWESLRTRPDAVPLSRAQRDELDRRLDELDRGETETIPWEEVKRRLRPALQPEEFDRFIAPYDARATLAAIRSKKAD